MKQKSTQPQASLKANAHKAATPDSFASATEKALPGDNARLPNRASSQGASEASGRIPDGGLLIRGEAPMDDLDQQALDEALELTFPGSDPAAPSQPSKDRSAVAGKASSR